MEDGTKSLGTKSLGKLKVIFLDVDGVLNCQGTLLKSQDHETGIDPYRVLLLRRILEATGAKVVVSSSWRLYPESLAVVRRACEPHYLDVTPRFPRYEDRGKEIRAWLDAHPEAERYAILDDDPWAGEGHGKNFFQTDFNGGGLTEEIAGRVIAHLNGRPPEESRGEAEKIVKSSADLRRCYSLGMEEGARRMMSVVDMERSDCPICDALVRSAREEFRRISSGDDERKSDIEGEAVLDDDLE